MTSPLILVTGATGKTGHAIAARLGRASARLRLASRSPTTLPGAQWSRLDWSDLTTFDPALADVERVYLLAPVGHNSPLDLVGPFIDKALAAGVQRFVLLSSSQLAEGGPAMGQIHAYLRAVTSQWSVLRPSWFMENFISQPHLDTIKGEGVIYSATGTGRVPFVAVDDIAEVGARVLLQDHPPAHDLLITGPQLLSYDDIARQISKSTGKPVRHVGLSVAELAARHERFGMPANYAQTLAGLDGIIAAGGEEHLSDAVTNIAGRPGMSFANFAQQHAAQWR